MTSQLGKVRHSMSLPDVDRIEVIGQHGRELVTLDATRVSVDLQDEGRTMKIFYTKVEHEYAD